MKSTKGIIAGVAVIIIAFFAGFKVSDYISSREAEKQRQLDRMYEEAAANADDGYIYPRETEEGEGISIPYTAGVLAKKSENIPLTKDEEDLIMYHCVQEDGYAIAITRFIEHDGGMGRATRRWWESADGGKNWNVTSEGFYNIGHYDFTYIDNIFIEAAFSTTAESGYFNISEDRGHKFKSIPYTDVFEYDKAAYAKKVSENPVEKTVTYQWIDLYTNEVITTVEYDFEMNKIKECQ